MSLKSLFTPRCVSVKTATALMNQHTRALHRRRRAPVCVLLGCIGISTLVVLYVRHQKHASLVSDLLRRGGSIAQFSVTDRLVGDFSKEPLPNAIVGLESREINDTWLRSREFLEGLAIDELRISADARLSEATVAQLIRIHPLRKLFLYGVALGPEVVAAIKDRTELTVILCDDARVDDGTFRQLPFERLREIHIAGTSVTPDGLLQIERCDHLEALSIHGSQLDESTSVLLPRLPGLATMFLRGRAVSDDAICRLGHMKALRWLQLEGTSVTPEGIATFKRRNPDCVVFEQ